MDKLKIINLHLKTICKHSCILLNERTEKFESKKGRNN